MPAPELGREALLLIGHGGGLELHEVLVWTVAGRVGLDGLGLVIKQVCGELDLPDLFLEGEQPSLIANRN